MSIHQGIKGERRINLELRKLYDKMSDEERMGAIFIDQKTGLPNYRAYELAEKKPVQVLADLDGLKWLNDNLGYEAGDAMVRAAAQVFQAVGVEVYRAHTSGDEFILQFDAWNTACSWMRVIQDTLRHMLFSYEGALSRKVCWKGIGISYGISDNLEFAEVRLKRHKQRREEEGKRGGPCKKPPMLQEVEAK